MPINKAIKIEIIPAHSVQDIQATARLFLEYANWLSNDHDISLEFQDIDTEIAGLPGKYANPGGQILLAKTLDGKVAGCIGCRPAEKSTVEIKRLYVDPQARGMAVGEKLVEAILGWAKAAGYEKAVLDTAGFMTGAQTLYEKFGFRDIEPYYHNPYPDMRFMGVTFER